MLQLEKSQEESNQNILIIKNFNVCFSIYIEDFWKIYKELPESMKIKNRRIDPAFMDWKNTFQKNIV